MLKKNTLFRSSKDLCHLSKLESSRQNSGQALTVFDQARFLAAEDPKLELLRS
jgi:hypothetical protein